MASFGNIGGGPNNNYLRGSGPGFNISSSPSSRGFNFNQLNGPNGPKSPKNSSYLKSPSGNKSRSFLNSGKNNNFLPALPSPLPPTPTLQP